MKDTTHCTLKKCCAVSFAAVFLPMGVVQANDLPAVNLGNTTFYDGTPLPGGAGWTSSLYYSNYQGRKVTDRQGDEIGLPKSTTHVDASILQLLYQDGSGVGKNWGLSFLLPVVTKAHVNDGLNNAVLDAQEGVGDLNVGAFLQFDPIMGKKGPLFAQRFEVDVIAPTGKYDKNKAINPGSNFWSFNPYWAGTLWATPKTTLSWRLHYLWNGKNDDPSPDAYGADARDMQAGQAMHMNFNALYALRADFQVGINGYWLKQFTDTQINGHDVSGRKEQVFAIGPGAVYSFSKDNIVTANVYFESEAQNRPEGNRLVLRWLHKL